MKIILLGATKFSEAILNFMFENNVQVEMVFAIPENFSISYNPDAVNYNYANLEKICITKEIPVYVINGQKGKRLIDYKKIIELSKPDIILVAGWYYKVEKKISTLAKWGAWGLHASLLPKYAGGAPLVWAIIEGQKETGVTLFQLNDTIDGGDIIAQKTIPILSNDTIKEVYERAEIASKQILLEVFSNYPNISFTKQDCNEQKRYPQRSPSDGEIDMSMTGEEMYNFIRAQASPYPGAFIRTKDNRKIIVEKAKLFE